MMDWYSGVTVAHYIMYLLYPIIMTAGSGQMLPHSFANNYNWLSVWADEPIAHIHLNPLAARAETQGIQFKIKQFLLERPQQTHKLDFCFLNHYWDSAITLSY